MKLKLYTLTTDDSGGTRTVAFGSETQRDDALLACSNLPNRGAAFAALDARRQRERAP